MPHDPDKFHPAHWLARWRDAGGGWAGTRLLLPPPESATLRRMVRDLSADEIAALAEHMGAHVEPVE